MKKTYIRPQALGLTFKAEGMFAVSSVKTYNSDGTNDTGADEALSNGRGWSGSAIWGNSDNE